MLGATLAELRAEGLLRASVLAAGGLVAVKEAVLPFSRFPDVDPALGPEMRSTGEVMGIDVSSGGPSTRPSSPPAPSSRRQAPCSCRSTTRASRPGWRW